MRWQNFIFSLQRFFNGRNGIDQLSIAIMAMSFLIRFIARFTWFPGLSVLYYVGFAYALYRILSQDIYKRRRDNAWFLSKINGLSTSFKGYRTMFHERKNYKHLKCPECGQRLRVPRGQGTVDITCAKCGRHIIKKV